MPDVKRQKTSARGSLHRNVRAGSPTFRLAAAIRRRLLAFGSFLERSGERAIRLSLFRAGEYLEAPAPTTGPRASNARDPYDRHCGGRNRPQGHPSA